MLIARAHQARALDDRAVRTLVASFSEIEPSRDGYGRAVARLVRHRASARAGPRPSRSRAPRRRPRCSKPSRDSARRRRRAHSTTVTWEAHAVPRRRRRAGAGAPHGGPRAAGRQHARHRAGPVPGRRDAGREPTASPAYATPPPRSTSFAPHSQPIEPSERTTASPPPDLASLSEQASRDLARVRTRADLKRAWRHRQPARARRGCRAGRRAHLAAVRHLARRPAGPGLSRGQRRATPRLRRAPDDRRRPRGDALAVAHSRRRATASPGTCAVRCSASTSAWRAWRCVARGTIGPTISRRSTTATAAR